MDVGGIFYYWPGNNSSISPPITSGGFASFDLSDNLNLTGTYRYGLYETRRKFHVADIIFAYKLSKYFSTYSGLKYINAKSNILNYEIETIGPSVGLNVNSSGWKNFFLAGDISFFWLVDDDGFPYNDYGRPSFDVSLSANWEWKQLTMTLGARYRNVTVQDDPSGGYTGDFKDTAYGIFASATLLLSI
jgi:hypothetical protein